MPVLLQTVDACDDRQQRRTVDRCVPMDRDLLSGLTGTPARPSGLRATATRERYELVTETATQVCEL
jgi:hypothetical protein